MLAPSYSSAGEKISLSNGLYLCKSEGKVAVNKHSRGYYYLPKNWEVWKISYFKNCFGSTMIHPQGFLWAWQEVQFDLGLSFPAAAGSALGTYTEVLHAFCPSLAAEVITPKTPSSFTVRRFCSFASVPGIFAKPENPCVLQSSPSSHTEASLPDQPGLTTPWCYHGAVHECHSS